MKDLSTLISESSKLHGQIHDLSDSFTRIKELKNDLGSIVKVIKTKGLSKSTMNHIMNQQDVMVALKDSHVEHLVDEDLVDYHNTTNEVTDQLAEATESLLEEFVPDKDVLEKMLGMIGDMEKLNSEITKQHVTILENIKQGLSNPLREGIPAKMKKTFVETYPLKGSELDLNSEKSALPVSELNLTTKQVTTIIDRAIELSSEHSFCEKGMCVETARIKYDTYRQLNLIKNRYLTSVAILADTYKKCC